MLADPSQVRSCGSQQRVASLVRQPGQRDPAVSREPSSLDEAFVHQPVHGTGESAGREHDLLGQFGHPEAMTGSSAQAEQHVVVAEREAVFGAQLGVELFDHVVMGVQQRLPCPQFGLAEVRSHEGESSTELFARANNLVVELDESCDAKHRAGERLRRRDGHACVASWETGGER